MVDDATDDDDRGAAPRRDELELLALMSAPHPTMTTATATIRRTMCPRRLTIENLRDEGGLVARLPWRRCHRSGTAVRSYPRRPRPSMRSARRASTSRSTTSSNG